MLKSSASKFGRHIGTRLAVELMTSKLECSVSALLQNTAVMFDR